MGLARAAEWLAQSTSARVLVLVPSALATSSELDSINFGAIHWTRPDSGPQGAMPEEQKDRVWPTVGRPHPFSPGEQLLAARLASDAGLAGLFAHNAFLRSRHGHSFLVDLLWAEGKVVVEIDGYQYHSGRIAFAADRQRDYELTVSGYLVLRLPHDEVLRDVKLCLEKIRTLVRFRRSQLPLKDAAEP